MTDRSDPLERLRAANPVHAEQLPDASESARARAQFEEITAVETLYPAEPDTVHPVPATRRRRRRRLVPFVALASLSLGGAAAYALVTRDATTTHSVACYQNADLRATTAVVASDGRTPVEVCAEAWKQGAFGSVPAPPLQGCVLESGVAGVFPSTTGEDVCAKLGLATLSASPPGAADGNFLAFKDSVVQRFTNESCVDPGRGSAIVREELDRAGLNSWTVVTGEGVEGEGFSAQRPCAGLAFEQTQHQVVLVPQPASS